MFTKIKKKITPLVKKLSFLTSHIESKLCILAFQIPSADGLLLLSYLPGTCREWDECALWYRTQQTWRPGSANWLGDPDKWFGLSEPQFSHLQNGDTLATSQSRCEDEMICGRKSDALEYPGQRAGMGLEIFFHHGASLHVLLCLWVLRCRGTGL